MSTEAENLPDLIRSIMEERRKRYSPEAVALVERARERTAKRQAAGIGRDEAMGEFHANYMAIVEAL